MSKYVIEVIAKHILYIFLLFIIFLVLYFLKIPCFFRFFTGIPCPSCGMTRAFSSLLKFNFRESFYYHPLLIPALFTAFIAIHKDVPQFKFNKKFCDIFTWTFIVIFFVVYFFRVIGNKTP